MGGDQEGRAAESTPYAIQLNKGHGTAATQRAVLKRKTLRNGILNNEV
jgi:hypothetical protein